MIAFRRRRLSPRPDLADQNLDAPPSQVHRQGKSDGATADDQHRYVNFPRHLVDPAHDLGLEAAHALQALLQPAALAADHQML